MMIRICVIILLFCFFVTCKQNHNSDDTLKVLKEKVLFLPNISSNNIKIVTYVDVSCSACVKDIPVWRDYLYAQRKEIDFYCYFSDSSVIHLFDKIDSLYFENKDIFIYDKNNVFIHANNLTNIKKEYRTFLLDYENKILIIGNPIYYNELWQLYDETIREIFKKK